MGILNNIHKNIIATAQNNLLYIVSTYFSQEKYQNAKFNQLILCQPDEEKKDKTVENFPVLAFKSEEQDIKYIKYEYRQLKVLNMIMMTPRIFIILTEEEIVLWNDTLKISTPFFEKYRNDKNYEIINKNIIRFDDDLFYIKYEIIRKKNNIINIKDITGLNFVLFSAKKIINEGKICELFFMNKIDNFFPLNKSQIFVTIKKKIQILDITSNKILKEDNNLEYINFDISYSKYLFDDLILLSSNNKNQSIVYSADKNSLLYFIEDSIIISFNLGKNKVVIIGPKLKEILLLPDMYVLSLDQYETDIFNSIENKSFYEINDKTFLFINHKTKKLKQVFINELNELIITKEIICPTDFITFCPFVYTHEIYTRLLCSLFICQDQTYQLMNHELLNLIEGDEEEQTFSSIKRLFLNFFVIDEKNSDYFKYQFNNTKILNASQSLENKSFGEYGSVAYVTYSIISTNGNSSLNFALYKNKKLYELYSFCNYFEPNLKSEIVYSNDNKNIYIISLIKNTFIYIIKINGVKSVDINIKHNFGNIKTKGIINLGNERAFIFFDKKAMIINIKNTFTTSTIKPLENYSFSFTILYTYLYLSNIVILSEDKLYLFDTSLKKIRKEIKLKFKIALDDNIQNIDMNILQIQDDIYILVVGDDYMLFNIENFEEIKKNEKLKIKNRVMLFFNSYKERFEVIKKDIINNKNLKIFNQVTDEQRHKMKYLSFNKIFVGTYPNKFFIFDISDENEDNN
jgi:hypothetical protein